MGARATSLGMDVLHIYRGWRKMRWNLMYNYGEMTLNLFVSRWRICIYSLRGTWKMAMNALWQVQGWILYSEAMI